MRRWEESAVAVATAIAQRVIRRELDANPEITLDLIREAPATRCGRCRHYGPHQPSRLRAPRPADQSPRRIALAAHADP